MTNHIKILGSIYENMNTSITQSGPTLASLVSDTLEWLLPIEDFEEAEDSCNAELSHIGMGRESVVYYDNGVIIKINEFHNKNDWEPYLKLDCFAKTELYEANFGLVILQEELQLDASEYWDNDIESEIENCLKASGLPYDRREITDENVGIANDGQWKLFDIPLK
jgi:hypothetical protein